MRLSCFEAGERQTIRSGLDTLASKGDSPQTEMIKEGRKVYDAAQGIAVKAIEEQCYSSFLASEQFMYVLPCSPSLGVPPFFCHPALASLPSSPSLGSRPPLTLRRPPLAQVHPRAQGQGGLRARPA